MIRKRVSVLRRLLTTRSFTIGGLLTEWMIQLFAWWAENHVYCAALGVLHQVQSNYPRDSQRHLNLRLWGANLNRLSVCSRMDKRFCPNTKAIWKTPKHLTIIERISHSIDKSFHINAQP